MIRTNRAKNMIGNPAINYKSAELVATFRQQRGFNQKKFAVRLGVNKKVILRLEQDGGCASIGDHFLICLCLGIKVVDFWRYLLTDETCTLAQLDIPIRPNNLYGLHDDHKQREYNVACKQIEQRLALCLAAMRKDCDKTMDQISLEVGRTYRSFINKVEDCTRVLRLSEFEAYCNALQVKSETVIADMVNQMEKQRLGAAEQ